MVDDVTVAGEDAEDSCFSLVVLNSGDPDTGILPTIQVHGKVKQVCSWSLFVFSIHSQFRQKVIWLVEWWWFDKFILFLILLNSILLSNIRYREDDDVGYNFFFNRIADPIFTGLFTVEFLLKVIALGLVVDRRSYLRDAWNCLDIVVVISSLISFLPGVSNNLGFLRVFRVLKPLRGLSALSQIKVLVRTMINCIPNLGGVAVMAAFFYTLFGIVGVMVFDGVFYRRCRTLPAPTLEPLVGGGSCWSWPYAEGEERYCGGRYMCESSGGFCGGHDFDPSEDFRPRFPGGQRGEGWCPGSEPAKLHLRSYFVHFDHMAGALLAIFQCMTLEGWTEIMYDLLDASTLQWAVVTYFLLLIPVTSFFLLNITLAAIDSVFADEQSVKDAQPEASLGAAAANLRLRCVRLCCCGRRAAGATVEAAEEEEKEEEQEVDEEGFYRRKSVRDAPWLDVAAVRLARRMAFSRTFTTVVMLLIVANVVILTFESFPADLFWEDFLQASNTAFLWVFTAEMAVMLVALGPRRYCTSWLYTFDGTIVLISWLEVFLGASPVFRIARAVRIVLKINKFARSWARLDSMLKAMWATTLTLKHWLVLFLLALYICTLMGMSFFANMFHFDSEGAAIAPGAHWCPGPEGDVHGGRQDCIPRAHFDTFLWAFVTVFQIMTGENWNTVMYDAMNASGWVFAAYFVWLILFGQVLVLSLFLSVLMSQFMEARVKIEELEAQRRRFTRFKTFIVFRVTKELAKLGTRTFTRSLPRSSPRAARRQGESGPASVAWGDGWQGPGSKAEATAVSKISVRPRSGEAGAEEKDPDTEKRSTVPTRSARPTQGRSARLRLAPRPDDPEPDSELITSTFLEALGAPKTAPPEEPEDDGASGGSSTDWVPSSTPSQSEAWEPHARAPCLRNLCRRRDQLREAARWLLALEVRVRGEPVRIVEGVVFVCIMLSTLVTIFDNPLSNPDTLEIQVVRGADAVFSVIFTVEILTKLVALGPVEFFTGPESGWNRLDAIVVLTSMLGLMRVVRGGAFRIVRIIRAIRPLRIISRAPTLRIVVQTVLSSMPGLVTLILGSLCCMLVFALLCITIFKGRLHHCENPDGRPLALSLDVGSHFTTPLCLRPNLSAFEERWAAPDVACANGGFREATGQWLPGPGCPTGPCGPELSLAWRRASPDTPICVGRCDPHEPPESQPPARRRLCPRRFARLEELPSACPAGGAAGAPPEDSEAVGQRYVRAMQRDLVLPCGGSSPSGAPGEAAAASCRAVFCPGEPEEGRRRACQAECSRHPHFCSETCGSQGPASAACLSCRRECEAACQCREFCEPLVQDAALCREQGLRWERRLSQHFDNFGAAMLSLFEISTTEGWVDLMYAAADIRSEYMEPKRDAEAWTAVLLFCLYIFLTNIFLLNLSVGLIVDNFIGQKQDLGGRSGLLLTEAQQRWVDARKALYARRQLFNLWDLHLLPKTRRKVYDVVSSQAFELFIMTVIALNILCLAMKVFPAHMESWPVAIQTHWNQILEVGNIVAGSIFLVEFLLKLYALQKHYWTDGLNVVDFLCLVTTAVSLLAVANRQAVSMLGNAMRIARCVRLVGFVQELKRLFRALILTLPKLANVMLTFLLLLIMYGILGVNLFAASKHSEEHAANGNFRNFFWAFLTLFRASTGEAWNEIMHDLGKSETDHFRAGGWCTPLEFFDTSESHTWSVLQSKCLLDNPNACASSSIFHPQMVSALYWVSFTMIITFLFMNLLLAVIIDSYQDTKTCPNAAVLDLCFKRWKRHDPDHRASLPLPDVMAFIHEVVASALGKHLELPSSRPTASGIFDLSVLPMRYAQAFSMKLMPDGRVHYLSAFQQVLRFMASECNADLFAELDAAEAIMGRREAERLRRIEERRQLGLCSAAVELRAQIAVVKLQRHFRNKVSARRERRASTVPASFRPASAETEAAPDRLEEDWEPDEPDGEPEERGPFGVVPAPRTVRQHHSASLPSSWLRRKTCSPATTVARLSRRGTDLKMEDLESEDLPSLSLEPRFFAASTSVPDDLEEEEV